MQVPANFDKIGQIGLLIEVAAEPLGLAGIERGIDHLIGTNLNDTIYCINYVARYNDAFIFLSTSRIYPIETSEQVTIEVIVLIARKILI